MSLYNYVAVTAANEIKKGVLEESDKDAAAKKLMQSGLRPLEIRRAQQAKASFSLDRFRQDKVTRGDVDFFTKQIGLLLGTGLSLDASLRLIRQHSHKPAFSEFTGQIERKLKEGKSFSQALTDFPKHFSSMYVNIARAGEEGGILPAMLQKITEYQATFNELKQFIISASIYPIFLMVVGMAAVIILVTTILPRFEILFEGVGQELPGHVAIMMSAAKVISDNLLAFFLVLAAIPAGIIYYFKSEQGKLFYDQTVIRVPVLSSFVRDLETTRIFRTLEVLVNNGVHLSTALKISSGVAANSEFQRLLYRATEALKEGQQVGQKLKGSGLLPDLAADLLSIGEESGRVGQVCGQIANHFEEGLRVRIKRIISLIEPIFILLIALIAGYVVLSMLTVILSINEIAG